MNQIFKGASFASLRSGLPRFRLRSIRRQACRRTLRAVTTPCAFLLLALTACNKKAPTDVAANSSEEAAIAQNKATSVKSSSANGKKIDYDLSEMNSNLVYAEVFNMMIEPEIYDDKVIKMRGNFVTYENSPTGKDGKSYAVIISDALACCKQGIEFHYDFDGKMPNDGDIITVTGVYVTAMLPNDVVYNYVKADSVEM